MSARLTREQVEELIFCMNAPETDGVHYAKFYRELMAHDAALREELEKVRYERDIAVAHDRQPYPTAWAYEQACKALAQAQAEKALLMELSRWALETIVRYKRAAWANDPDFDGPPTDEYIAEHDREFAKAHAALASREGP